MAGHLCFGSFLKILTLCSPRSTTQKFLCGTMFLAVNPRYDIRGDDGTVGHLINCSNNISSAVTDNISTVDPASVYACFETQIVPKLYPEKRKYIIHALIDLLFKDNDIGDDVRIGIITANTKGYYRLETRYNLAEVLTEFFFFAVQSIDNKSGQAYIREITPDYIQSFEPVRDNIILVEQGASTGLTMSVRGKGFEDAFVPVGQAILGLRNPEDCQIFRLKIEDNEFTYAGLTKYLNTNIGRYVYSRAEMEQYKAKGDLESVGMDAAQYLREHSTGNELADMLLYAFLEEVLRAPKLLSSIELGASTNCAGIHLHTIRQDVPAYQMVYGSSQMEGDLKSAIDAAFDAVVQIKAKRISAAELVNSAAFGRSVDVQTALTVKDILLPTKQGQEPPGTAFGLFLGYSLGLNPEDYSATEFIEEAVARMESAITENAEYISQKIAALHLGMHSFYIYVLPFNNAPQDKVSIVNMLIGGGT
mgnify:FL=1